MDDELMSLDILSELQKMCEDGESVSGFDLKSLIDNSRAAHKLKERVEELEGDLEEIRGSYFNKLKPALLKAQSALRSVHTGPGNRELHETIHEALND